MLIPQPFRVVYDMEKNRYYRINNITGSIEPSYKTGKTPAKFDPNITGTSYLQRFKTAQYDTIETVHTQPSSNFKDQFGPKEHKHKQKFAFLPNMPIGAAKNIELNNLKVSKFQDDQKLLFLREANQFTAVESNIGSKSKPRGFVDDDKAILPRLRKRNSESHVDYQRVRQNQNKQDSSYIDSINRLKADSANQQISQSRLDFQKFQKKLKKYSQIEQNRLTQNTLLLTSNNYGTQKLQKFSDNSLMTSIIEQCHLTFDQSHSHLNLSGMQQNKKKKTITRRQVEKCLDELSKQKVSLMMLTKKGQENRPSQLQNNKDLSKRLSQPDAKPINMQEVQMQHKLKSQIQKEKQTFLSFYPRYIFKENLKVFKEQKDRKINLKKLEMLSLQNNQKKFGRIYRSESKNSDRLQTS